MKNYKQDKNKYPYPSRFGSHASMINHEETAKLNNLNYVVCTDEFGDYITLISSLDNGLADVMRHNRKSVWEKMSNRKE